MNISVNGIRPVVTFRIVIAVYFLVYPVYCNAMNIGHRHTTIFLKGYV